MIRTRLRPDRRTVVLLGAILVGIVAGGSALLFQQQQTLAAAAATLEAKEKQREESARLAGRLAETELRLKADTDRLRFLEASLPSVAYVPTLLKQIEQLCKDTHNEVRSVRPEATQAKPVRPAVRRTDPEAQDAPDKKPEEQPKPEPYTRLAITVAITGSYADYQSFLQQLTRFPKIIAVDRVQLRPRMEKREGSSSPLLDVDMQLTAFILKDATTGGLEPSTAPAGAPSAKVVSEVPITATGVGA